MKKKILIALTLLISMNTNGVEITHDPTTYGGILEQIQKYNNMIKLAEEQIDRVNEISNIMSGSYNMLTNISQGIANPKYLLERAKRNVENVKNTANRIKQDIKNRNLLDEIWGVKANQCLENTKRVEEIEERIKAKLSNMKKINGNTIKDNISEKENEEIMNEVFDTLSAWERSEYLAKQLRTKTDNIEKSIEYAIYDTIANMRNAVLGENTDVTPAPAKDTFSIYNIELTCSKVLKSLRKLQIIEANIDIKNAILNRNTTEYYAALEKKKILEKAINEKELEEHNDKEEFFLSAVNGDNNQLPAELNKSKCKSGNKNFKQSGDEGFTTECQEYSDAGIQQLISLGHIKTAIEEINNNSVKELAANDGKEDSVKLQKMMMKQIQYLSNITTYLTGSFNNFAKIAGEYYLQQIKPTEIKGESAEQSKNKLASKNITKETIEICINRNTNMEAPKAQTRDEDCIRKTIGETKENIYNIANQKIDNDSELKKILK